MNAFHLRHYIVRPALEAVELWSPEAEDLVMGTASQESHLEFVRQLGNGPAVGLFQIEPDTYADYWLNYLNGKPQLADRIRKAIRTTEGQPGVERLIWDFRFSSIMCRIHYRRISAPLPEHGDIAAYAAYWKKYYNTIHGAGTVAEFIENYERVKE